MGQHVVTSSLTRIINQLDTQAAVRQAIFGQEMFCHFQHGCVGSKSKRSSSQFFCRCHSFSVKSPNLTNQIQEMTSIACLTTFKDRQKGNFIKNFQRPSCLQRVFQGNIICLLLFLSRCFPCLNFINNFLWLHPIFVLCIISLEQIETT